MEIAKLWTRSFDTKFLTAWSVGRQWDASGGQPNCCIVPTNLPSIPTRRRPEGILESFLNSILTLALPSIHFWINEPNLILARRPKQRQLSGYGPCERNLGAHLAP